MLPPAPAAAPSEPAFDARSSLAPVSVSAPARPPLVPPQPDLSHLIDELASQPRPTLPRRALVPLVAAVIGVVGLAFLSWKATSDEQFYASLAAEHARETAATAQADRAAASPSHDPAAALDAEAAEVDREEQASADGRSSKRRSKARRSKHRKRSRARRSSRLSPAEQDESATLTSDDAPAPRRTKQRRAAEQAAPFSRDSARAALSAAAGAAQSCRASGPSSTRAVVSVTFAPSGRATTAVVSGGSYAGTRAGSCIAQAFRRARVTPFAGSPVTVRKTVRLP